MYLLDIWCADTCRFSSHSLSYIRVCLTSSHLHWLKVFWMCELGINSYNLWTYSHLPSPVSLLYVLYFLMSPVWSVWLTHIRPDISWLLCLQPSFSWAEIPKYPNKCKNMLLLFGLFGFRSPICWVDIADRKLINGYFDNCINLLSQGTTDVCQLWEVETSDRWTVKTSFHHHNMIYIWHVVQNEAQYRFVFLSPVLIRLLDGDLRPFFSTELHQRHYGNCTFIKQTEHFWLRLKTASFFGGRPDLCRQTTVC